MKKRFMIALCCLILLMQILPIVPMADTAAAQTVDKGTVSQELYYCRTELSKLPNGQKLVAVYDRIVAGVNECATEIEIGLSEDEFKLVLDATVNSTAPMLEAKCPGFFDNESIKNLRTSSHT